MLSLVKEFFTSKRMPGPHTELSSNPSSPTSQLRGHGQGTSQLRASVHPSADRQLRADSEGQTLRHKVEPPPPAPVAPRL